MEKIPLENLLALRKPEDVQKFLNSLNEKEFSWRNIGNDETNFRQLAFSKSGVRALIERITNSIDAVLEDKKSLRQNPDDDKIKSPREALQKWFELKDEHISSIGNEKARRELAQKSIHVAIEDSGIERKPTVKVKDWGIGLHPDEFDKTIVGLGGSLKINKKYLLGAYGWGGSQTFIWCNGAKDAINEESLPLAIIVSRKNPKLLTKNQKDEVGWTIVRFKGYVYSKDDKYGVFQYLTNSDGKISKASPNDLPKDFGFGTHVTHLAYDMEKFYGRMTLASYRMFQGFLFDPILPFWLYDARHKEGRTISGNLSRLTADEKNLVDYANVHNMNLPFGTVKIRYWVLKSNSGGYHIDSFLIRPGSSDTIAVTLNGQQYGSLSRQIIKEAGFSFLSDYIIFQIECDSLPSYTTKNIFTTTREDVRDEYRETFKQEILLILQTDEELKKLEEARKQDHLMAGDQESIKKVRRLLDKLIAVSKRIVKGEGKGKGKGKGEKEKFKPKEPPTFLKILPQNRDLEFIPGEEKKVTIQTDAANDFLTRDKNPGNIECSIDNPDIKHKMRRGFLRDGKINFYIFVEKDVPIGKTGNLICKLDIPSKPKLEATKEIEIVTSPPPLPSNYPPTIFEISNEEMPLKIYKGKRSLVQIRCDGPDELLERPIDKARLNINFLPDMGIQVLGRSDLARHKIRVFLQCPENLDIGKRTNIICELTLADKTVLTAQRECVVSQAPLPPPGEGAAEEERPNYELIPVMPDDDNWIKFQWDETNVGRFDKSGDELLLFVSLGNKNYLNALEAKSMPTEKVEAFKQKYLSYVGFHLYLMNTDKIVSDQIETELKRICQTVLLTLDQDSQFR